MPWRIEVIRQEPSKTLDAWSVFEVSHPCCNGSPTRHLVGFCVENLKGQVSSVVEVFDPSSRRAITRSGRVYELRVGPGLNADAFVV